MLETRKIYASLLCLLMVLSVWAIPVERRRFMATLADGSKLMITSCGNEQLSFFLTDDDRVVELTDSGFVLTDYNRESYVARHVASAQLRVRRKVGSTDQALLTHMGRPHVALLLLQFQDKLFSVADDSASVHDYYDRYCNGWADSSPYTGHGSSGAVTEYFSDQSQGQFQPVFEVIGPLTLDSVYAYYGQDSSDSKDINYNFFVKESIQKACRAKSDWSSLDNNGDGKVDMAVLLYAGMGQNYTNSYGDKNTIWPKEMSAQYQIDGVTFSGCSSTCELRPTAASDGVITATKPDGIGVFCHELSHALGLPDFYDTNYKAFGMDYWSLMDYGQYAVNGMTPVGYTAYEREFMGWQQIEELKEPCTLRIPCFSKGGHGYKIVNEQNSKEYYVLENRQGYGWDKLCQTRGHGLMVTHVDYDRNAWLGNRVNTTKSHQRMTIIPANNSLVGGNTPGVTAALWTQSLQGNLYPGTAENHELTNESTPASVVFTGGFMGKPVYDIEETDDDMIVLKYNPLGTLREVRELMPMDVLDTEATLMWEAVDEAEAYNIRAFNVFDELVLQTDSISTPNYQVRGLEPETSYSFSVQAIADQYRNSEWTAPVSFRTSQDVDGLLDSILESPELVRVYDTNGRMVAECKVNELSRLRSRSGIYIIRYGNGKTRKILVAA